MSLTDVKLRSLNTPGKHFDGAGLYLEVTAAGGRYWRLKYRFGGKEKRLAFGVYPEVTLKAARQKRDEARRLLADGLDPGAIRQADKAEQKARQATEAETQRLAAAGLPPPGSLEVIARDWLTHRGGAWVEKTRTSITRSFEQHVFPTLGRQPLAQVTPADIRACVQAIDAAGAGETATRVFQRLRALFRYAVAHELACTDPTYPLRPAEILRPRTVQHRAALSAQAAPGFLRLLADYPGDPSVRHALRLLMLTAVRPGELRGARWAEFDEAAGLWRIPAERMKMKTEHLVPLSVQALAVLEDIRPLSGAGELVFPSPYYPRKPISDNTLNSALARMGYKGQATAHGFRTLFSTCANEAGHRADVIERQLAHEERDDVRGAYNRAEYLAERKALMTWWGTRVDAMQRGAEVIPFKTA